MQNIQKGFTLIELTVTVAIIMILAIGATSINFNTATDKEFLNALTNKVASNIEKHRNNSLIGKGVGVNLEIPNTYSIDFSTSGSESMIVRYTTGTIFQNLETIPFNNFESISSLVCYNPTLSLSGSSTDTTLLLEKNNLSLSGCTIGSSTGSILEITTKYKANTQKIVINTLTGRVEKK